MVRAMVRGLPALLALVAVPASGQGVPAIGVTHAWTRPTPGPVRSAAVYLTLTARGTEDALVGAASPAAGAATLHETRHDGDVMRMRQMERVALPAGRAVTFAPGGLHLMLTGLARPLRAGESVMVTLRFAHAAPVTVGVAVEAGGGDDGMAGMKMP